MTVDNVALGTLAGRTAAVLNASLTSLTATFLMKRIRYFLYMFGKTAGDDGPLLVFINRGDASTPEIASAILESNTSGPQDTTQTLTEDTAWVVYQNTLRAIVPYSNSEGLLATGWLKLGGRNGIPAVEGAGFALHIFNASDAALATGVVITGIVQVQGVWLRD